MRVVVGICVGGGGKANSIGAVTVGDFGNVRASFFGLFSMGRNEEGGGTLVGPRLLPMV